MSIFLNINIFDLFLCFWFLIYFNFSFQLVIYNIYIILLLVFLHVL